MTMNRYQRLVTQLEQRVRNRDGVRDVNLNHEPNSGLSPNNDVVSKAVFKVSLLPAQKDEMGKAALRDFFWKEAHGLELSPGVISLVIDDMESPVWDPQI